MSFTTDSRTSRFQGLGVPFTGSSRAHRYQGLGVPFTGSSRVHRFAADLFTRRVHLVRSYTEFTTGTRAAHRFAGLSQFTTGSRAYQFADRAFWTNTRAAHRVRSIWEITTPSRVSKFQANPMPTSESGDDGEFEWVTKGISIAAGAAQPVPTVSFTGASGVSDLDCETTTLVVSGAENSTSSINVNLTDNIYKWHPYGNGANKDVMAEGEEISARVSWGSQSRTFCGIMKRPVINWQGGGKPQITWAGIGHSSKLFKSKKTLSTLGRIGSPTGQTNKDILAEVCNLVSLNYDVKGIRTNRVQGPYHRQQLYGGQVAKQMLDLTMDNWCDEEDRFIAYNPEVARNRWRYTLGEDIVHKWSVTPEDNEVYDKVVVLRAIATGKLKATGDNVYTEVDDFGEYTVSLGGLSGVTTKVEYAHYKGQFSDFRYSTANGLIVRAPKGYWSTSLSGPIVNATSVTFTWGAKTPEVTAEGVTNGAGAISFYGAPHRGGTTGTGASATGSSDYTTRRSAGSGDNVLEFSPNPLLDGRADMDYLAAKALRRLGKPWIQHAFEMPLNHLITVGDWVKITGSSELGGGTVGEFEVVSYQHTISRNVNERKTVVTLRELLE